MVYDDVVTCILTGKRRRLMNEKVRTVCVTVSKFAPLRHLIMRKSSNEMKWTETANVARKKIK